MDLADFFAIDRLSEHDEETLVESAMQLQQVMMLYESGIREIKTKLDILADESRISGKPSPINAIKSRIKTPRSIVGKLKRRGFPVTLQSMMDNLNDIGGWRNRALYIALTAAVQLFVLLAAALLYHERFWRLAVRQLLLTVGLVILLMGVNQYQQLPDALEKALGGVRKSYCMDDHTYYAHDRVLTTPSYTAYTRIGEGCSNCCTFCAIPKIRGPYRSRPEADILREIESLAKQGVKEHILVAQDTSRYGMDFGGGSKLAELMQKAAKIDGVDWLRVLYCYPEETSEQLLDIIANTPNICSYVDLPIQHVNDAVLKRMHRRYSPRCQGRARARHHPAHVDYRRLPRRDGRAVPRIA